MCSIFYALKQHNLDFHLKKNSLDRRYVLAIPCWLATASWHTWLHPLIPLCLPACKKYVAQVKVRRGRGLPAQAELPSGQRSSRLSCLIHYHPPPSRAVLIRMCFDHPGRIGRNVLSLKEGLGHGGRPWNQSGIVLSPLLIHEVHPSWAAPLHIPAHKKSSGWMLAAVLPVVLHHKPEPADGSKLW